MADTYRPRMLSGSRLFWQVFPAFLLITTGALLISHWYGSYALKTFYYNNMVKRLEINCTLLRQWVETHLADPNTEISHLQSTINSLGDETGVRLTVILPDGKVIADSDEKPEHMDNHFNRAEIHEAIETGDFGQSFRFSNTIGTESAYVALPIYDEEKNLRAVVRASRTVSEIDGTLDSLRNKILLGALLAAGLITLVSWVMARKISRPIEIMTVGALRFAEGDLSRKIHIDGANELENLADAMNRMANELNSRFETILKQRNEQAAVLDAMIEGVLAINEEGRIINMNPACMKMLDTAPSAMGKAIYEIIRNSELIAFVDRVNRTEMPVKDEILLNEGSLSVQTSGVQLYGVGGKHLGALLVLHDITELKRLENIRREFVANVSHELRTPITSIKGFIETLLDGALEDHENAKRFLEITLRHTDRLNAIISDILCLSRIERDEENNTVEMQEGHLADLTTSVVQICQAKADKREIKLQSLCAPDLRVRMNAPLLEQAVCNLVDNAINYSDPGTEVALHVHKNKETIRIQVVDHGCGIPSDHLSRLFDRFYRVDRARSRDLGGTGLGLSIVKHIVQAQGGRVGVTSKVGEGSTFWIDLPVHLEPAENIPQ